MRAFYSPTVSKKKGGAAAAPPVFLETILFIPVGIQIVFVAVSDLSYITVYVVYVGQVTLADSDIGVLPYLFH